MVNLWDVTVRLVGGIATVSEGCKTQRMGRHRFDSFHLKRQTTDPCSSFMTRRQILWMVVRAALRLGCGFRWQRRYLDRAGALDYLATCLAQRRYYKQKERIIGYNRTIPQSLIISGCPVYRIIFI